jgi:hypothetical protein
VAGLSVLTVQAALTLWIEQERRCAEILADVAQTSIARAKIPKSLRNP